MPTNVLQKNQTYPELGYRIDGKGIAFDLETGQPLSRQEVDGRIAQAEDVDPASNDYAERISHRGGVAGAYDRNKQIINPVVQTALGMINPAFSAAYGAAVGGLDHEGEGGVRFDVKDAAIGGVKGYGMGKLGEAGGNLVKGGIKAFGSGSLPTLGNVGSGASSVADASVGSGGGVGDFLKSFLPNLGGGGTGGENGGLSAKDWLAAISGGVGAGLDYKTAQSALEEAKNQFARKQGQDELKTAVGAQDRINRAPMADNAQALLLARMGGAPTTFAPRDYTRGPMTAQTMAAPATGGPQDALASARTAAANYQPGQGGVDTGALKILRDRMYANAKVPAAATSGTGSLVGVGANGMTFEEAAELQRKLKAGV